MKEIAFADLRTADLYVDALYRGGTSGNLGDDPLAQILPCGNSGGFRVAKSKVRGQYALCALYTTLDHLDWPDHLDLETGLFTYFGDNREPGHELHDTKRGGNALLRRCYDAIHSSPHARETVPPFLVFSKHDAGRDLLFRGLAVPGARTLTSTDDLVAIWRISGSQRFQNYRAMFSILDTGPRIARAWLDDLLRGDPFSTNAPTAWVQWVTTGRAKVITGTRTVRIRSQKEQLPTTPAGVDVIRLIHGYFKSDPVGFEHCAAELVRMMDPHHVVDCTVTRPWVDGGRDAIGSYRIGHMNDAVLAEFAMEAKCYALANGVGVKETSRLISRLKHRQFGVFVTTSYLAKQAYEEIREDRHPVVVMAARDIVDLLNSKGYPTTIEVGRWLETTFPL